MSRAPPTAPEIRHTDLLIATMKAVNDAEAGRGETTRAQFGQAIGFLWSASPNIGQTEITLFGVERRFGQACMPVTPDAPMTGLSVTWRCSMLLTIAQMLDIGSARSDFDHPDEWLILALEKFGSRDIPDRTPAERPKAEQRKKELLLRADADYLRLASATMKDPRWHNLSTLTPRDRSKAISRLARELLNPAEARSETPRP